MPDRFQWAAMTLGVFQAGLIIVYLAFFVDPPEIMFVSDVLFKNTQYMVLMTLCVVSQLGFCVCYAYRHRREYPTEFYIMGVSEASTVIGWFLLNSFYIDSQNEITKTHVVGVCLFILGSIGYMCFLVRDSWYAYRDHGTYLLLCRAVSITVFFVACVTLGGMFMNSFINHHVSSNVGRTNTVSWIYEHTGYLLFTVAHIVFFAYETPDPFNHKKKPEEPVVQAVGGGIVAGVSITADDLHQAIVIEKKEMKKK